MVLTFSLIFATWNFNCMKVHSSQSSRRSLLLNLKSWFTNSDSSGEVYAQKIINCLYSDGVQRLFYTYLPTLSRKLSKCLKNWILKHTLDFEISYEICDNKDSLKRVQWCYNEIIQLLSVCRKQASNDRKIKETRR